MRGAAGRQFAAAGVRDIVSGRVVTSIHKAKADEDEKKSAVIEALGVCAGQIVDLNEDGTLRFWDITGAKPKLLSRHAMRAQGSALAADPASTWAATSHADRVQPWKAGQPARALPVDEKPDGKLLAFVKRGVLAVGGGAGVDVWNLEKGEHIGRLDKPVTSLAAQAGRLIAGDAKGKIWAIDVP